MKPRLTILLAAGSTINLGIGPPGAVPGMPSTKELTERIAGLKYPAAVRAGVPFLIVADQKSTFGFAHSVPILPLLNHALRCAFEYVDFETILHSVEQLEPIVSGLDTVDRTDQFHSVLSAFVDIRRNFDLICDRPLLNAVRLAIIKEIQTAILNRSLVLGHHSLALHRLVQTLESPYRSRAFFMCMIGE